MVGKLVRELVRMSPGTSDVEEEEYGAQNNYGGWREALLIVTGDHSTPVAYGDHSPEPVPFVVANTRELSELVCSKGDTEVVNSVPQRQKVAARQVIFGERSASQGVLGRFAGAHVLPLIHSLRDACAA